MKRLIVLLLFVSTNITIVGQNVKINGKVLDEESNTVIAATVALISDDSVLISGTISDNQGHFELATLKKSESCLLRVTHIGYENVYISLVPDRDTTLAVQLNEKTMSLSEVEVVAKKPIYEFQNEKLVVHVNNIPNIQTFNVSQLLHTLPGVVNSDGALTLNGRTATVYLNGRKQTISINTIIQSMPVDFIEKIELIYSSGGTNDASDETIINIVYKKQRVDGYYLSAGGNSSVYEKNHLDGEGFATIMFKKKNVMINSMFSYRNTYSMLQANDTLQYWNSAFLYQDRNSATRTNAYLGMLNMSWDVRKGHNLNFNFNFYEDFSDRTSRQQYTLRNDDITHDIWNLKSKGNGDMWSGQVEYTSPDTLKNKFKASYGIVYGGLRNYRNTFDEGAEILDTDDEMIAHRHTIKFDYEHIFSGKINLLFGLKADLGQLNDDVIYTKTSDSERYPTNHFFGRENIYAGYTKLNCTFNTQWSASASLRAEHTYYFLDFKTFNEKITDSYTNLFPFLTVSYNSKSQNFQSSLSLVPVIERPDYESMLPAIRYSNQYFYTKGNPEQKPTIAHTLEWRNIFYQFINIFMGYGVATDLYGTVAKNSSIDPLIVEYEHHNVADYSRVYAGGNIYYKLLSDKLSGRIGGYTQHVSYKNLKHGFELWQGKNDTWYSYLNATGNYQITKQLGINCNYYLYPESRFVYIVHTRWLMNAGAYYNSPKDNWSLSLNVYDIFNSNKTFREQYFDDNYSREHFHRNSRFVQLSFILKLKGGEKVEDKAKRGSLETDRFSKN
ncbi:MAG: outer membrane beta-barrel protein [Dysgonamonadaceae bacterium]|jgi:hypothetical protein|nr:outer membrane beta-barrel protein [Dysgonamonadaceae bacterium]